VIGGVPTLALNGSPSATSRTATLARAALELAGGGRLVDVATLDAEALLGRRPSPEVDELVAALATATVIVAATPVYRATYTASLKAVFDLLPVDALRGSATVPIATGALPDHRLAIDHGLRPLVASLGGWTVPTGVYATHADFEADGAPRPPVMSALRRAVTEATTLARAGGA